MATELKVPSDIPVDPVKEGDTVDSPIPDVQDHAAHVSDDETEDDVDGDSGEEDEVDEVAASEDEDTPE